MGEITAFLLRFEFEEGLRHAVELERSELIEGGMDEHRSYLTTSRSVPISPYRDVFGNWCSRIVAPAGRMRLSADGLVRDTGLPDVVALSASQHAVEDLPAETLIFLLGSR